MVIVRAVIIRCIVIEIKVFSETAFELDTIGQDQILQKLQASLGYLHTSAQVLPGAVLVLARLAKVEMATNGRVMARAQSDRTVQLAYQQTIRHPLRPPSHRPRATLHLARGHLARGHAEPLGAKHTLRVSLVRIGVYTFHELVMVCWLLCLWCGRGAVTHSRLVQK